MPDRRLTVLLIAALVLGSGDLAAEQFLITWPHISAAWTTPVDARGEALGRAAFVDPRGPTALWWNPAPLIAGNEISASYTDWEFPYSVDARSSRALRLDHAGFSAAYLHSRMHLVPRIPDDETVVPVVADPHYGLDQLNLAVDIPRHLPGISHRLSWSLGLTRKWIHRNYQPSSKYTAASTDWGASLAWRASDGPRVRLRLHATITFRDRFREGFGHESLDIALARSNMFGVGLEGALMRQDRDGAVLAWMLACATQRHLEEEPRYRDRDHLGIEFTVLSTLSLRAGHHRARTAFFNDEDWTWGAGLQRRFDRLGGLTLQLDYAAHRFSYPGLRDRHLDHWTVTVRKKLSGR